MGCLGRLKVEKTMVRVSKINDTNDCDEILFRPDKDEWFSTYIAGNEAFESIGCFEVINRKVVSEEKEYCK